MDAEVGPLRELSADEAAVNESNREDKGAD